METNETINAIAGLASEKIIDDLSDRRGLGDEWDGLDADIQVEIRDGWREIIAQAIRDAT